MVLYSIKQKREIKVYSMMQCKCNWSEMIKWSMSIIQHVVHGIKLSKMAHKNEWVKQGSGIVFT